MAARIRGTPSAEEAEAALSALTNVLAIHGSISTAVLQSQHGSGSFFCGHAFDKIRYSFHQLRSNPSLQRMVISLSTDAAVWEAIMRNKAVQELNQCFLAAGQTKRRRNSSSGGDDNDIVAMIIRWILENARTKIGALVDKIANLASELFQFHPRQEGKNWEILIDVVTSSFMLSIMVLIVVVVSRAQ